MAGSIVRYFVDDQRNRGKAAVINMMNAKLENLRSTMIDTLETSLFNDGTGDNGKEIDGLANIVDITPATGTVGEINGANRTWWRNNATTMTGLSASIYLRKYMSTMFNDCGQQGEGVTRFPNLIVTSQGVYEYYESEALEISRIMIGDKKLADLGFGDLAYKGRPITWSPAAHDTRMYFLNTNFIEWIADPIANFDMTELIILAQVKSTLINGESPLFQKDNPQQGGKVDRLLEVAYIAGVMDSDGWFTIHKNTRQSANPIYSPSIGLNQVTKGSIDLFMEVFGGKVSVIDYSKYESRFSQKPMFSWRIQKHKLLNFLQEIKPFLRNKRRDCEILIALKKNIDETPRGSRMRLLPDTVQYRDELWAELRKMHGRNSPVAETERVDARNGDATVRAAQIENVQSSPEMRESTPEWV